jgi:DNA-binding NtrC family response regulator
MPKAKKQLGHLANLEMKAILTALDAHSGNRTWTANFLGISLRGLLYKLEVYRSLGVRIREPERD